MTKCKFIMSVHTIWGLEAISMDEIIFIEPSKNGTKITLSTKDKDGRQKVINSTDTYEDINNMMVLNKNIDIIKTFVY